MSTPPRPPVSALRRGVCWAADYLYAGRRQLAVIGPPWAVSGRRPAPASWATGSPQLPEVVLVPGVYEHWTFLAPLGRALNRAGYRVSVVHGLGMNRRGVAATAERLARSLARRPPPDAGRVIVAHSKGGLIGKHVLMTADASGLPLRGVIAVATPFGGSRLAGLFFARSIRAFLPEDETILTLGRATSVNGRIVSIFGPYDPHIPEGSALDGATNILVPTAGHFRVLGSSHTVDAVIRGLELLAAPAPAPADPLA